MLPSSQERVSLAIERHGCLFINFEMDAASALFVAEAFLRTSLKSFRLVGVAWGYGPFKNSTVPVATIFGAPTQVYSDRSWVIEVDRKSLEKVMQAQPSVLQSAEKGVIAVVSSLHDAESLLGFLNARMEFGLCIFASKEFAPILELTARKAGCMFIEAPQLEVGASFSPGHLICCGLSPFSQTLYLSAALLATERIQAMLADDYQKTLHIFFQENGPGVPAAKLVKDLAELVGPVEKLPLLDLQPRLDLESCIALCFSEDSEELALWLSFSQTASNKRVRHRLTSSLCAAMHVRPSLKLSFRRLDNPAISSKTNSTPVVKSSKIACRKQGIVLTAELATRKSNVAEQIHGTWDICSNAPFKVVPSKLSCQKIGAKLRITEEGDKSTRSKRFSWVETVLSYAGGLQSNEVIVGVPPTALLLPGADLFSWDEFEQYEFICGVSTDSTRIVASVDSPFLCSVFVLHEFIRSGAVCSLNNLIKHCRASGVRHLLVPEDMLGWQTIC